jgi:hypothetical protein
MAQFDEFIDLPRQVLLDFNAKILHCSEYHRLRRQYEDAIRHWGHFILSPETDSLGAFARQTDEKKQKAYAARDATKKRLTFHMLTCVVCSQSLNVVSRRVH